MQANPFGVNVRMQYISKEDCADNVQLGTYGTIKGAKDFLAITVKDQPFAMKAISSTIYTLLTLEKQLSTARLNAVC